MTDPRVVLLFGLAFGIACAAQPAAPAAQSDSGSLQPFEGAVVPPSADGPAQPAPMPNLVEEPALGASPPSMEGIEPSLPLAVSGVVVVDGSGSSSCVPLCRAALDPSGSPSGDWSAEAGTACVIPGTITASSQSCTPGAPLPTPQTLPGVVVVDTNLARCAPLCAITTATGMNADGSINEWGFENGASCVIPGTLTARGNQPCTTGQPLPAPRQIPGVVVVDMNVPRCAPLCLIVTSLADDPDADGWSYENNLSCVVPGTPTALANQPCTTGGALPDAAPRPGLLLADGLDSACRPLCQVVSTASSAAAPDWGYEQNTSCVLPDSPTAQASVRQCSFGGPVDPLVPPSLPGNTVAAGFFVQAGRLRDAYGNDFVIRGVNNPHIWFDTAAQYQAYRALDSIAGYGTNTIRVVWETTGPARLLREILYRIVQLRMVPIVELHDVTSSTSRADLLAMAQYYASADVRQVLNDFRQYVLVNIANEWNGTDFLAAYTEAVSYLRSNGLSHTLVIDANGSGQNGQAILDNAAALTAADPQRNLLFSVHMYERFTSPAAVDNLLNAASSASIALIVGEFGWQHGGQNVAWERILTRTSDLRLGYIAWSWWGNGTDTAQLDMASDYAGPLTTWGNDVMTVGTGNIQSTSQRASIFQ